MAPGRTRAAVATAGEPSAAPALGRLAGFHIGVTAVMWAERQVSMWRAHGAEVDHTPIAAVVPLPHGVVAPQMRALLDDPPDAMVFTSRAGVIGLLGAGELIGRSDELTELLDQTRVVATSPEAVTELDMLGFAVDAAVRGDDPRELTAGIAGAAPRGGRVVVEIDCDLAHSWNRTLLDAGFEPMQLSTYRWGPPPEIDAARRFVRRAVGGHFDAVTFISCGAVDQFAAMTQAMRSVVDLSSLTAVCVNRQCASLAERVGFGTVLAPKRAGLGAMVRTAAVALVQEPTVLELGTHRLVIRGRGIELDRQPLALADRERAVLFKLLHRPGAVVPKAVLAASVWGPDTRDHVVEVSIGRLRQRLGPIGGRVETVFRRGYRFNADRVSQLVVDGAQPRGRQG